MKVKMRNKGKKSKERLRKSLLKQLITSIRFKLIISFLVPIAFIIFLGAVSYQKAADGLRSRYEHSTMQTMNMTGEYLKLGIKGAESLSSQYQSDDSIKNYFIGIKKNDTLAYSNSRRIILTSLSTKKATDDFISEISILSDRTTSLSTIGSVQQGIVAGFNETKEAATLTSPLSMLWVGTDTYLDEKLGVGPKQYSLRLIRKIAGTDALIIIDINHDMVQDVLTDVKLDNAGTIGFITSEGKEILNGALKGKAETVFSNQDFYKKAVAAKDENGSFYVNYRGERQLFLYSKIGKTGAMVCAIIPNSCIIKQADSIRSLTFWIVIVACAVAVIIAAIISGGIGRIIKYIIAKLHKVSSGDLTIQLQTKRKDEFLVLIKEMNETFSNMKKLAVEVKNLSGDVSDASVNVKSTSGTFVKTTGEISQAMNEVEKGILQQAEDAQNCLRQMDNLSSRIAVLSDNTSNINQITGNTKQSIQAGTLATSRLTDQTESTKQITAAIVKEIESLADKSKSIDVIINVIDDISSKTNLLSLNASIEAARAGEAGRGFGVVAGEIRHLAEQTRESVNDIKNIIYSIRENTDNAVKTADEAEVIMVQQEEVVKDTTDSYFCINDSVDQLMSYMKNIVENVDSIEEARVSTLGAIENISAVLQEMAAAINNVNQTAESQLTLVETLNRWAGSLNKNAEQLVTAANAFQI